MQHYFITGTDTEVGKTYSTSLLARTLVQQGQKVACFKPVAAGAEVIDGELQNDDAIQLQTASNMPLTYRQVNPFCFEPPIAPHIAAQQLGQTITTDIIKQHYRFDGADVVLTEGAGGWLVPLNAMESFADIPAALDAKVILVVGMKLGCINHALLTVASIDSMGLELAGWIANQVDPKMSAFEANLTTLKAQIKAPLIGRIAFNGAEIEEFNWVRG